MGALIDNAQKKNAKGPNKSQTIIIHENTVYSTSLPRLTRAVPEWIGFRFAFIILFSILDSLFSALLDLLGSIEVDSSILNIPLLWGYCIVEHIVFPVRLILQRSCSVEHIFEKNLKAVGFIIYFIIYDPRKRTSPHFGEARLTPLDWCLEL